MELKRRLLMGGLDPLPSRLLDGLVGATLLGICGCLHERQGSLAIARGQRRLTANSVDGVLERCWS